MPECAARVDAAIKGPHLAYTTQDGVDVFVLGVEHCVPQPHLGEFILRNAPHSVVLETSLTRQHGARTGNVILPTDDVHGPESFFFRMFLNVAARLKEESNPLASETWAFTKSQLFGEQIAYVAAFASGSKLVFGDRPKEITYRRLLHLTSVEELDRVFAQQSAANYREVIHGESPAAATRDNTVARVMISERDAVLCSALHGAAADAHGSGKCVVALVGAPARAVKLASSRSN